ncbi:protein geranylgeranyltransferase type II [Tieghemostelium lacteum]|uniref:Geranylgeranyl transferase type-2 subunit alpha n=1 Tax=Tieghemostelium lacteum TaxID=361077 RepID=A0A151ZSE4_TIELA|nr:protein geranylgeranyltransferase type II [Tieghemostelium lacteum]|eukprot:KYQ96815.1 protein geranylgeranyltransferase type II [Tieghemostelium lacteum]
MHGVLKVKTSEEKARELKLKELEKIKEYQRITTKFNEFRSQEDEFYEEKSLDESKIVLENNPEYYSIWNYRRSVLEYLEKNREHDEMQTLYKNEMKFIEECIQRFTKSYWIWFHRKWISLKLDKCDWERELKLCSKLLDLDLRNFHCWSYRRFILKHSGIPLTQEFDYTTKKIEQNFSNYSAWHQRSSLLTKIYTEPSELASKLKEELEWVRNAVYTEPKDQSSWVYHKWLTGTLKPIVATTEYKDILKSELGPITELMELEPDCKWPLYISLLLKLEIGEYPKDQLLQDIQLLIKLDPYHINYYKSLENKI